MNDDIAISVDDLHKEFVLPTSKNTSFKQTVVNVVKSNKKVKQKVLDGVSFEINKGDFFGIVGKNGSGKSTLLKLIAGVYTPTRGSIEYSGGITPFIELGVGFNPELSGRDNVYLNGALLGYTHKQVEAMYDEIVQFAEIEPFMDQKLKNYSSGMQVRLAFSIAVKAKNDILIFDEVLAVGDEAFQQKCLDVFERYKAEGQTVVLVTHDMNSIRRFCTKALLLESGSIKSIGNPQAVATMYSQSNDDVIAAELDRESSVDMSFGAKTNVLLDKKGKNKIYETGELLSIAVDVGDIPRETFIESIGVSIFKQSGEHVTGENSRQAKVDIDRLRRSGGILKIEYNLNIKPGRYYVYVEVFSKPGVRLEDIHRGLEFIVKSGDDMRWSGLTRLQHEWKVSGHESR